MRYNIMLFIFIIGLVLLCNSCDKITGCSPDLNPRQGHYGIKCRGEF